MRVLMMVLGALFAVAVVGAGEIHDAVAAGDAARVTALLRAHPELVQAQNENSTRDLPLHTAAIGGQLEVARLLLDAGAEVDGFDADESTPLHVAALNRHPALVDLLVARGADVNRRDRNGAYALSFAIVGRDSTVVRHVLDAGADLNYTSATGTRLMHLAVSRGLWDIVDRLLARGEDINVVDRQGQTPMHWLGYGRNPQFVRRAIALGAQAAVADTSGRTPLHNAAERGNLEIVQLLAENGAVIETADHFGWTPLAAALLGNNVDLVRYLLERGADPNHTVWQGTPILFLCLRHGGAAMLQAMLDGGARVDAREPGFDATLLHQAVEFGYADCVTLLLDRGCDPGARERMGRTALDVARQYGHTRIAQLLSERRAPGAAGASVCSGDPGAAPPPGEAKLWYLGHSGWAIETARHFLVFDYSANERGPDDPGLCNGNIAAAALAGKNVTVFASHEHTDHFHAPIFDWRSEIPRITYVMGFRPPDATGYEYVAPHETRDIGGVKVTTIPANDSGEGFWVEVDGLTFFHAGDHACRTRDLSGNYTPEIQFLAGRGRPDIAFLPVSGCNFGDQVAVRVGTEYTLETLSPKLFLPMHGGRQSTTRYRDFIDACGDRFPRTRMQTLYAAGDHFVYRDGKAVS